MLVHSLVKQLGLLSPGWSDKALLTSVAPTPAHDRDLTVYHDADYLDFIFKPRNRYESSEDSSRSEFGIEEVHKILNQTLAHVIHRTARRSKAWPTTCGWLQEHPCQVSNFLSVLNALILIDR